MTLQEFIENTNEEDAGFESLLVCKPEEREKYIQEILAYRHIKSMIKRLLHEQESNI